MDLRELSVSQTTGELRELLSAARSRRQSLASGVGLVPQNIGPFSLGISDIGEHPRSPVSDAVFDLRASPAAVTVHDAVHCTRMDHPQIIACAPTATDRLSEAEAAARHELLFVAYAGASDITAVAVHALGAHCNPPSDPRWAELGSLLTACGAPAELSMGDVDPESVVTAAAAVAERVKHSDSRFAALETELHQRCQDQFVELAAAEQSVNTAVNAVSVSCSDVDRAREAKALRVHQEAMKRNGAITASKIWRLQQENIMLATELRSAHRELSETSNKLLERLTIHVPESNTARLNAEVQLPVMQRQLAAAVEARAVSDCALGRLKEEVLGMQREALVRQSVVLAKLRDAESRVAGAHQREVYRRAEAEATTAQCHYKCDVAPAAQQAAQHSSECERIVDWQSQFRLPTRPVVIAPQQQYTSTSQDLIAALADTSV